MNRTDHILAAVMQKLELYRAELDGDGEIHTLSILVRLGGPRRLPRSVSIGRNSEGPVGRVVEVQGRG